MSKPWDKNPTKRPVKHFSRRVSISMLYAKISRWFCYFGNRTSISSHGIKSMSEISQGPPGLEQDMKLPFFIALNDLMP